MAGYEFYSHGKLRSSSVQSIEDMRGRLHATPQSLGTAKAATRDLAAVKPLLKSLVELLLRLTPRNTG